jgi:hypothetical protein
MANFSEIILQAFPAAICAACTKRHFCSVNSYPNLEGILTAKMQKTVNPFF